MIQYIDDYKVTKTIGSGGYGTVVEARDTSDRRVAIKLLHPSVVEDPKVVQRFFQEALILAKLEHPAIPQVSHFGPWEGTYYLVQEFIEGQPCHHILTDGPLDVPQVVDMMVQLLDALAYAHVHEIIHRDLKPRNLLLTSDGQLKVLDFGIAKIIGGISLTAPGTVNVTPSYGSPEQLRGKEIDGRADLYAAGIILHELLTGDVPFQPTSREPFASFREQLTWAMGEKESLRTALPNVPDWLDVFYLRCVAANADDRYPDAVTAHEALKKYRATTTDLAGRSRAAALRAQDPSYEGLATTDEWSQTKPKTAKASNLAATLQKPKRSYKPPPPSGTTSPNDIETVPIDISSGKLPDQGTPWVLIFGILFMFLTLLAVGAALLMMTGHKPDAPPTLAPSISE